MDEKQKLKRQAQVVISKLTTDYADKVGSGIMELILERYKRAVEIIDNNEDITKMMISGGIRAYLDSYSDYDNPILEEMHKAEKMWESLAKSN